MWWVSRLRLLMLMSMVSEGGGNECGGSVG